MAWASSTLFVKQLTVCSVLSVGVAKGWNLREKKTDLQNAFLHGIEEQVCMILPLEL
jgi:hypothetical protein